MKIKEIINYEWKKKNEDKFQKRAIKILIYFIILMIICGVISRFAASLTVPIVETKKPTSASITHEISESGIISENKEEGISVIEGITIDSINVKKGSSVKKGDAILTLNKEEIQEKINEAEKELLEKDKALTRAIEDYDIAVKEEERNIQNALKEMNDSKEKLDKYTEGGMVSKEELEADYESKKNEYNNILNKKEINLLSYKRAIEDANYDYDKEKLNSTLNSLRELYKNDGNVISNSECVVTNILLNAGDVTTGKSILLVANKDDGYKFLVQVSSDYGEDISIGQEVSLKIGKEEAIEGLTINSVVRNEENEDMLDIIVLLPKGVGEIGKNATLKISQSSENYFVCVPVAALHSDGDKYYVLVIEDKETVLGTESIAKRVDVTIEDKDGIYVAVGQDAFIDDKEVIISSNKNIQNGDKVRKEEN